MVEINWTFQALDDLDHIAEYIAQNSVGFASAFVKKAFDKPESLKQFPKMGRKVPEIDREEIRELIMGRYRMVYYLKSDVQIDILTVHDSTRPLPPSFMFS